MYKILINKLVKYGRLALISLIFPVSYFAPIGEWLVISFFSLLTIVYITNNIEEINLKYLKLLIISILILVLSYFWSINQDRTMEVIGPVCGILIAIYISLFTTKSNNFNKIETIIGIPIIITASCIFLDLTINTGIRSSLAVLAGDEPTSISGNYSRGLIVLSIIMPITSALLWQKKQKIMACAIFILISLITYLGPNETSKFVILSSYVSILIIYFLGPRSFLYFGIVSCCWVLFVPIISKYIIPKLSNIEYRIDSRWSCEELINSSIIHDFPYYYEGEDKFVFIDLDKIKHIYTVENGDCFNRVNWQETSVGGSIIHRLLVWEYVGNKIFEKTLLGHGLGTSRFIGQNVILNIPRTTEKSEVEGKFKGQEIKGAIPLHPHNNFLEIWLELGLLGISLILYLWYKIIKYGLHARKVSYILGTGICVSIVNIFVVCNLSFGAFQGWWMSSIGLFFLIFLNTKFDKKLK